MTRLSIPQAMELAISHHRAGNLQQAESIYRQILNASPDHPEATHLLGVLAGQAGQMGIGIDLIKRSISANPREARYHSNLGQLLNDAGSFEDAIAALRKAVELNPNLADAWNNLGNALHKSKKSDEAIEAYRRAIALNPGLVEGYSNLGNALRETGRLDEAIAYNRRAIGLRPDMAEAHNNLGNCLRDLCQIDEAIAAYRQSLRLRNDRATTHFNLATCLLVKGDFDQGLMEYEWRWLAPDLGLIKPDYPRPIWDGSELNGKRLLLYAEQGFGDAIQFIRYASLAAQRGGKIVLTCPPPLVRLMQRANGVDEVVQPGTAHVEYDVQCSLLGLPRIFGTTVQTIPANMPYITADPELSSKWRERVSQVSAGMKIGLAWAGRPEHANDRNRSSSLAAMGPLSQLPNAAFFSLQKDDLRNQSQNPPVGLNLIDWTSELTDFADTAGLIDNLDVVIAVDTAVAHLAGAMGKRVCLLLPFSPDWRWLLQREDTPWYPTMRLYRQPAIGDWDTPVRRIVDELSKGIG